MEPQTLQEVNLLLKLLLTVALQISTHVKPLQAPATAMQPVQMSGLH